MEKFEDVYVGFMFNEAQMPFFRLGSYPAYTLNDEGKIVTDRSDDVLSFQAKARHYQDLVKSVADKIKRGKRVPQSWIRDLEIGGMAMIIVMEENKLTITDWAAQYHRMVRYLRTAYQPPVKPTLANQLEIAAAEIYS